MNNHWLVLCTILYYGAVVVVDRMVSRR